jgi:hypothetical protein
MGGDKGKNIEMIKKKEMKINVSRGHPWRSEKKEKKDVLEEAGSVSDGFKKVVYY